MDRVVRLFNPYMPSKPVAYLKTHSNPIFYIHLCHEDNRIFTVSTDKCLNVWDVVDHSCLSSNGPKSHKINGELQYCYYNSKSKSLLINTDKVCFLALKQKTNLHTEVILSHKEPIVAFLYNKHFKQIVSCTENGTVKVWDVENGKDIFEFSNAHGEFAVTCMTFDDNGRRLITGGRDGLCKIWNYNNGHCLRVLNKESKAEVADVKFFKINNNAFIINVGWDKSINIYEDDIMDVRVSADPIPRWSDDIENGHKEDIICLTKSDSNFLATSAYDGLVIVWNMVSGHIFAKLVSPKPENYNDDSLECDLTVNKMLFFNKERFGSRQSAHIVCSGPRGMMHFWTVFQGVEILARFAVNEKKPVNIVQMCMDARFLQLFAADLNGYMYAWDIEGYATNGHESKPPTLVKMWRGHVQMVTSLAYIDSSDILISSSSDCTIRVWTPDAKYIGTFGQDEMWNLYDMKTYKHPLVPYDILIDESSMPDHPMLNQKESYKRVLESQKKLEPPNLDDQSMAATTENLMVSTRANFIDDETILGQLKSMVIPTKVGKRLRHEITKSVPVTDKGATKNYYEMLKCFDYNPKPAAHLKPPLSLLPKAINATGSTGASNKINSTLLLD